MPDSPTRPSTSATASDWLRPRLGVTWRTGRVAGVTPRATYVVVDHPAAGMLAVEGPAAVGLPVGLVLADGGVLDRMIVGQRVTLGRRGVTAAGWEVAVRRWHRSRPVPGPADAATVRARLLATGTADDLPQPAGWPPADPRLLEGAARLVALAAGRAAPSLSREVVDDLLGYGPGSTPAGDDLLAGFVATVTVLAPAWGRAATSVRLGALVHHLRARAGAATTGLSATLLAAAIDGAMARPAAAVLDALTADAPPGGGSVSPPDSPSPLAGRLAELARVGHTSGRDLALGIVAAALHLTDPRTGAAVHLADRRSTRSATRHACTATRDPNGPAPARADARS